MNDRQKAKFILSFERNYRMYEHPRAQYGTKMLIDLAVGGMPQSLDERYRELASKHPEKELRFHLKELGYPSRFLKSRDLRKQEF